MKTKGRRKSTNILDLRGETPHADPKVAEAKKLKKKMQDLQRKIDAEQRKIK
jgi:hypothetical protein